MIKAILMMLMMSICSLIPIHYTVYYVPHPDDEVLFMGEDIVAADNAILVLLTQGGVSKARDIINSNLDNPLSVDEFKAARAREFKYAAELLDAKKTYIYDLPDGGVTSEAVLAIIQEVEQKYPGATHKTLFYTDWHSDHKAAGEALREAHRQGIVSKAEYFDRTLRIYGAEAYLRWKPEEGFYGVGAHSVPELFKEGLGWKSSGKQ